MSGGSQNKRYERVQLQYCDLAGYLRGVEVPAEALESSRFPASFDGSSVCGLARVERSDLLLEVVPETLRPIPWQERAARALCRIYEPGGIRLERDPRLVAERVIEHLAELGMRAVVGAEVEFFLFKSLRVQVEQLHRGSGYSIEHLLDSQGSYPIQLKRSYHSVEPTDPLMDFRLDLSSALELLGYGAVVSHHEVAASQIELSLRAGDPVFVGDEVLTTKWAARNLAGKRGLTASFLAKPVYGDNGSGMHLHFSLWALDGSRNLFADEEGGLSELARSFVAGVLEHARSLSALVAPTTNSYRRLVPGYEAPVYAVWGYYNRTAVVRVPASNGPSRTRIEFRAPDPTANPYLALAATIMAGLDGVKRRLDPGDPLEVNAYELSEEERRRLGVGTLPSSLGEALDELESDNDYLRPVFSRELVEAYVELKRREAREVESRPHPYEIYLYAGL
ncbi:MAG: type I glutamate--ammonia ligase [Fervidicoccaceae archaeon]